MNKLIPKNLLNRIPKLYETEEQNNPIAYVKLFLDGWTWFITEISIDNNIYQNQQQKPNYNQNHSSNTNFKGVGNQQQSARQNQTQNQNSRSINQNPNNQHNNLQQNSFQNNQSFDQYEYQGLYNLGLDVIEQNGFLVVTGNNQYSYKDGGRHECGGNFQTFYHD